MTRGVNRQISLVSIIRGNGQRVRKVSHCISLVASKRAVHVDDGRTFLLGMKRTRKLGCSAGCPSGHGKIRFGLGGGL